MGDQGDKCAYHCHSGRFVRAVCFSRLLSSSSLHFGRLMHAAQGLTRQ